MTQVCAPKGCYFLARFFAVDQCSFAPLPGLLNGYAIECFRNVEIAPNVTEGSPVTLKNECGKTCYKTVVCDTVEAFDVSIEILRPDYELESLLTGHALITDPEDPTRVVGIKTLEDNDCRPFVGVELFSDIPAGSCDDTALAVRREVYITRFGEPAETAETDADQVTFRTRTFSGTTIPFIVGNYGTGPWQDSWIDFAGDDENSHKIEFDDEIDRSTLAGECGLIEVPVLPAP